MSNSPRLLFIILDGFDFQYMQLLRKLPALIRPGLQHELAVPGGFGVRGMLFSGTYPETNGLFTDFFYQPTQSRFRIFRKLPESISRRHLPGIVREIASKSIRLLTGRPAYWPDNVNAQRLSWFDLSPNLTPLGRPACYNGVPDLFTVLKERGIRCIKLSNKKAGRLPALRHYMRNTPERPCFFWLHDVRLDHAGHRYGPDSPETASIVKKLDRDLTQFISECLETIPNLSVLIASDHGMNPVHKKLDLSQLLEKLHLKEGKDYLLFLDSTAARFWFSDGRDGKAARKVSGLLETIEDGTILRKEESKQLHIDFSDNRYGDLTFYVKPGILILPNYFQHVEVKGMHGYLKGQSPGIFLLRSDRKHAKKENAELVDVFPTLLNLFDIPSPPSCQGSSLIEETAITAV
ncbi:alkaline phosphatase family protein [candidate division KSB1 bacterium]